MEHNTTTLLRYYGMRKMRRPTPLSNGSLAYDKRGKSHADLTPIARTCVANRTQKHRRSHAVAVLLSRKSNATLPLKRSYSNEVEGHE